MFNKYRNRGGVLKVNLNFGFGILSYNKIEFDRDLISYQIKTIIFLFIKYEEINYRYKNMKI